MVWKTLPTAFSLKSPEKVAQNGPLLQSKCRILWRTAPLTAPFNFFCVSNWCQITYDPPHLTNGCRLRGLAWENRGCRWGAFHVFVYTWLESYYQVVIQACLLSRALFRRSHHVRVLNFQVVLVFTRLSSVSQDCHRSHCHGLDASSPQGFG